MLRGLAILVAPALLGCTPEYGTGGFLCSSGMCPEGYVCVLEGTSQICRSPGTGGDRSVRDRSAPAEAHADRRPFDQARGDRPGGIDATVRPDAGPGPDTCAPQPYFKDGDGDGFGNPLLKVTGCVPPVGYVLNGQDCDDGDAEAHPGQTTFFEQPSKGAKSFDFNCDKIEEKEHGSLVSCSPAGAGCTGDGWSGAVPACGQTGSYAKCFKQSGMSACSQTVSTPVQRCR
jgi:hypothetical protein